MIINLAGGRGIMGKTHKPIFKKAGYRVIVSGRKTKLSLEKAADIADVTIISVPISATEEIIQRVAPYSKALIDVTGVKVLPVEWMLKYSNQNCEVMGMHPLYKNFYKGATIVACPTKRTGEKCRSILSVLCQAGAKIKVMTPKEHDEYMDITQNRRVAKLMELGEEIIHKGISVEDAYDLSPKPSKILLDLLARQVDEENDDLYGEMAEYNFFTKRKLKSRISPREVRDWFGEKLKPAQRRADKYIRMR